MKGPVTTLTNLRINPSTKNPSNGFYLPQLTTAQRNAIPASILRGGAFIYNTTVGTDQTYVNSKWVDVVPASGNPYVSGPGAAVDGDVVIFDGTSGNVIKDSNVNFDLVFYRGNTRYFDTGNSNYSYIRDVSTIGAGDHNIAITDGNFANDPSHTVTIGIGTQTSSPQCVIIGNDVTVYGSCDQSVSIGYQSAINPNSGGSVAVGAGATVGSDSNGSVAVGAGATVGNNSTNSIAIGAGAAIGDGIADSIAFGEGTIATSNDGLFIGNRFLHMQSQTAPSASGTDGIYYVSGGKPIFNSGDSKYSGVIATADFSVGSPTCGAIQLTGTTPVTINTTAVTRASIIIATPNSSFGGNGSPPTSNPGTIMVGNVVENTSFKISSSNTSDTSYVNWILINP